MCLAKAALALTSILFSSSRAAFYSANMTKVSSIYSISDSVLAISFSNLSTSALCSAVLFLKASSALSLLAAKSSRASSIASTN
jgi:hypothetical protein